MFDIFDEPITNTEPIKQFDFISSEKQHEQDCETITLLKLQTKKYEDENILLRTQMKKYENDITLLRVQYNDMTFLKTQLRKCEDNNIFLRSQVKKYEDDNVMLKTQVSRFADNIMKLTSTNMNQFQLKQQIEINNELSVNNAKMLALINVLQKSVAKQMRTNNDLTGELQYYKSFSDKLQSELDSKSNYVAPKSLTQLKKDLTNMTFAALKSLCKEYGITNYSGLLKKELIIHILNSDLYRP